ncbi:hypothetical protein H5410_007962 [Solanum commersonii]|uniref:Protein kinase domain-containing protein n=1 Tax=Solanum commersonii TaxID=4109 RepID=A0A9J6ADW2_SOLCO|nr:hypothetical protein H5410_007962 [Solanum commersonii]
MLANATDRFHSASKLGQGGFGPVYKGKLPDGQEIAVKKLSQSSGILINMLLFMFDQIILHPKLVTLK